MTDHPSALVSVPRADLERVRDLLMERIYGSNARSPGHNARLEVEAMLAAAPDAPQAAGVGEDDGARLLWNRFAVAHHESWDDEPNKAEYRQAAADVLALRAQPPAREDAQPVGWQRRIRNTAVSSSDPKSQWSKWTECDDRQRRDVQETGGVPGFPELVAEVRPIYTHPAPDALRAKGEELVKALKRYGFPVSGAETVNLGAFGSSEAMAVDFTTREFIQALAALQAEQKGGAA